MASLPLCPTGSRQFRLDDKDALGALAEDRFPISRAAIALSDIGNLAQLFPISQRNLNLSVIQIGTPPASHVDQASKPEEASARWSCLRRDTSIVWDKARKSKIVRKVFSALRWQSRCSNEAD